MKTMRPLPSLDTLRALFNYDPATGKVTWAQDRKTKGGKIGQEVGSLTERGYRRITLRDDGISHTYKLHRIAWALHYGEDPYPLTIDHINRDKTDNRIDNLRAITLIDNLSNRVLIRRKKVKITYPDGRGSIVTDSIQTAARILGRKEKSLRHALNRGNPQLYWGIGFGRTPSGIFLSYE